MNLYIISGYTYKIIGIYLLAGLINIVIRRLVTKNNITSVDHFAFAILIWPIYIWTYIKLIFIDCIIHYCNFRVHYHMKKRSIAVNNLFKELKRLDDMPIDMLKEELYNNKINPQYIIDLNNRHINMLDSKTESDAISILLSLNKKMEIILDDTNI